jgi:hypothetical protein
MPTFGRKLSIGDGRRGGLGEVLGHVVEQRETVPSCRTTDNRKHFGEVPIIERPELMDVFN